MRRVRRSTAFGVSSAVVLMGAMCGGPAPLVDDVDWPDTAWDTGETGQSLEPGVGGIEVSYSFGESSCADVAVDVIEVQLDGTDQLGPLGWPCDDAPIRWLNLKPGPYSVLVTAKGEAASYPEVEVVEVEADVTATVVIEFVPAEGPESETDLVDTDLTEGA